MPYQKNQKNVYLVPNFFGTKYKLALALANNQQPNEEP
jgi:hypothetical protein